MQINFQNEKRSPQTQKFYLQFLDFSEEIDYKSCVTPPKFSPKDVFKVEIKNLLHKGVIKESQHEEGEHISPIFLTPKSDD